MNIASTPFLASLLVGVLSIVTLIALVKTYSLRKREKMIAIMAHQINTLLTVARWNSEIIMEEEDTQAMGREERLCFDRIYVSITSAMEILYSLKMLASKRRKCSAAPPTTVDTRQVCSHRTYALHTKTTSPTVAL